MDQTLNKQFFHVRYKFIMSCNTKNLLHIIFIVTLCICLNRSCIEGALKILSQDSCSYTIQVSSLFPSSSSSSCVLSSKASNTESSLRVVHRHGPCSSLGRAKTSIDHDDIFRRDQARVDAIHSKLSKNRFMPSQETELQAKPWDVDTLGSGTYVVTVGIGTPKHDLSLLFDTGSDLTWTQCEPCNGPEGCYNQTEPIFNPSSSSSFSNVSSSSSACKDLDGVCPDSLCCYDYKYSDNSTMSGFLAKEKFTLTSSVFFDDLNFGCGTSNKGLYGRVAGILGLGRGELSFPSQTAKTYNNIFSYCIPSSASYNGHLTFGSDGFSSSVKYTPISTLSRGSFYSVSIVGISVCGQRLEIPPTVFSAWGTIIDSGTEITRLPPRAYAMLIGAFLQRMSNYKTAESPKNATMDMCYDFTDLETVTIPKIAFSFSGGTVVELDPNGILYMYTESRVCLAFAPNNKDNEAAIFGNVQQQTLQVVFDDAGGRVGFAPNGCS